MGKIIIKNESDINDVSALNLVQNVIKYGRVSNNGKQYCCITVFEVEKKDYQVITDLRKCSDVFTIINCKK